LLGALWLPALVVSPGKDPRHAPLHASPGKELCGWAVEVVLLVDTTPTSACASSASMAKPAQFLFMWLTVHQ
jgi:hypothetical protein